MGDVLLIAILIGVIGMSCFWLLVYGYGLYCLGRKIAKIPIVSRHYVGSAFWLCTTAAVIASPAFMFLSDPIGRAAAAFAVWLLHAQPTLIGLWAGLELKRKMDIELFKRRTDHWLREWEEPIPDWMKRELE